MLHSNAHPASENYNFLKITAAPSFLGSPSKGSRDANFMSGVIFCDCVNSYDPDTKQQSWQFKSPKSPRPKMVCQAKSASKGTSFSPTNTQLLLLLNSFLLLN